MIEQNSIANQKFSTVNNTMVVGNQATFESAFTKKVSGKSLIKNACGTAKGPSQPQAIKTDALWKPIIRKFR